MSRFMDSKFDSLTPYVPGEQPKNTNNLIKLNTNENPFPPSPKVVEALNRDESEHLNLYSDPSCDKLVTAIAENFGLDKNQVITSNGSDEILAFCFQGLCENGAIYNNITYGFYEVFAELFKTGSIVVPLREDFSIRIEDYKGLQGTIFITNPNAPTGRALSLNEIIELLEQDRDRLVIVDEAYVDFGAETAVSLINSYDNLLVIQTFSKSRSLAGARLGYAMGNSELIRDLNTIKFSFNPYNVNRLTSAAGIEAIKDSEYFNMTRNAIMENREYTIKNLTELGFDIVPSSANFIFASPSALSCSEYFAALRQKNIIVRYWDKDIIRDWTRITIGTREQMEALVAATAEIINGKAGNN